MSRSSSVNKIMQKTIFLLNFHFYTVLNLSIFLYKEHCLESCIVFKSTNYVYIGLIIIRIFLVP